MFVQSKIHKIFIYIQKQIVVSSQYTKIHILILLRAFTSLINYYWFNKEQIQLVEKQMVQL